MTSDLELYLRGLYRNRWPCKHFWYDRPWNMEFICSKCGACKTYMEIAIDYSK